MKTAIWNQKLGEYCGLAADQAGLLCDTAKAGCERAWSRASSVLLDTLLSEVCIYKVMLLSYGVLIGAAFSDFFKKHRFVLYAVTLGSAALFLCKAYRLLEEMEEPEEF